MRKRIIAGNWKMHKDLQEAVQFVEEIAGKVPVSDRVEAVICPPAPFLVEMKRKLENTAVRLGAQTMHEEQEGAFTGEISPKMLTSLGVEYAIVGHSERREYYNETDEAVNRKVHAALKAAITPLICVGETLEQRENGQTVAHVAKQVERAFATVSAEEAVKAVVAYEPIWAIGTGRTATSQDANEVCGAIRSTIQELYGTDVANAIRIQYGGSVNPENIAELLATEHIDGALVGGASLQPDSFRKLIEAAANE